MDNTTTMPAVTDAEPPTKKQKKSDEKQCVIPTNTWTAKLKEHDLDWLDFAVEKAAKEEEGQAFQNRKKRIEKTENPLVIEESEKTYQEELQKIKERYDKMHNWLVLTKHRFRTFTAVQECLESASSAAGSSTDGQAKLMQMKIGDLTGNQLMKLLTPSQPQKPQLTIKDDPTIQQMNKNITDLK